MKTWKKVAILGILVALLVFLLVNMIEVDGVAYVCALLVVGIIMLWFRFFGR